MSDEPTPNTTARLERLERSVRKVRCWLLISLVVGLVVLAFALGRGSAMRQFQPRAAGPGAAQHPPMGGPQQPMDGPRQPMDGPKRPKR